MPRCVIRIKCSLNLGGLVFVLVSLRSLTAWLHSNAQQASQQQRR
jgi:hypothetical protein